MFFFLFLSVPFRFSSLSSFSFPSLYLRRKAASQIQQGVWGSAVEAAPAGAQPQTHFGIYLEPREWIR